MKLEKEVYISGYDKFKNCHGDSGVILKLNILNPNNDDLKYIYNYAYHYVAMTLKVKEPILDEEERKYLSGVIRPFRDRNITISKNIVKRNLKEFISIHLNHEETIYLPYFEKGTMYKGIELNKEYTLEELGL